MQHQNSISRRQLLKTAAAAGCVAVTGGLRSAWAQGAKRIERIDPGLDRLLSATQSIQELGSGYGGAMGPAEGPLWWKESGYLLFSDIHNDRRMKYTPGQGVTLFKQGVNRANGLTRDMKGRLIACEHDTRRVTRQELDGSITVVANSFQGKRLNRPNDVVVKSDGSMYFTDPTCIAAAPAGYGCSMPRARNSVALFTGSPRPPTWALAATIGKRFTSLPARTCWRSM